jgi:hypothetical protein
MLIACGLVVNSSHFLLLSTYMQVKHARMRFSEDSPVVGMEGGRWTGGGGGGGEERVEEVHGGGKDGMEEGVGMEGN